MVIDTTHDIRRPRLGQSRDRRRSSQLPSAHQLPGAHQAQSAERGDEQDTHNSAAGAARFVGQLLLWAVVGFVALALLNTALGG